METLFTTDTNGARAVTFDIGTHANQALGQIDHFWLHGCVFQNGFAIGKGRCHQQVLGTRDGDDIKVNACSFQTLRFGFDIAIFNNNLCTHSFQTTQMQIDWTATDATPARKRHLGIAMASQNRSKHQNGGAHGFDQFIGCRQMFDGAGVHLNIHFVINHHFYTHAAKKLDQGSDIMKVRQIADCHWLISQQGCSKNWQSRVFGTGYANLAIQTLAT